MKISINSTYSYILTNVNYGSTLQCFALQKYLVRRGHQPEHIRDYRANPILILKRLRNIRYFKPFCAKVKAQINIHRFIKNNISVSKRAFFTEKSMFKHCPQADCYIAGSDQIWRNANGSRYLNYAPNDSIKLSYAASIGRTSFSAEMTDKIKPWIRRLDGISVRENTAVKLVTSLTGRDDVVRLIDPTLLLDADDYPFATLNKNKYCFCYFLNLGNRESVCFDAIKKYALKEKTDLIITAPNNYSLFLNENLIFPSVEQWLGYYKNADCIFTNTYHGMLFCIIFKKQFLFFIQKGKSEKENDRFYSLMTLLGLENRMVTADNEGFLSERMKDKIDYDSVYRIINSERMRTDAFFEKYGL